MTTTERTSIEQALRIAYESEDADRATVEKIARLIAWNLNLSPGMDRKNFIYASLGRQHFVDKGKA